MMLALMTLAGVMVGTSVALIVRGAMSPTPDLNEVVADLHRPRVAVAQADGVRERVDDALRRFALLGLGDRRSDLEVCERSVGQVHPGSPDVGGARCLGRCVRTRRCVRSVRCRG